MCHPMTIGKVISNYGPKRKKGYPKSIHLVGTGNIEVRQEMFKTIVKPESKVPKSKVPKSRPK